jgi:hypothetical protein
MDRERGVHLHMGWPKTGTTTLQAALAEHRPLLRGAGIVYPDRWSRNGDDSHNGLTELLRRSAESAESWGSELSELTGLLAAEADADVLLSSESLTTWLLREDMCEALLAMVGAVRDVVPVRPVWVLRRLDDMAHSLYAQLALAGIATESAAEFMERVPAARMFAGMRALDELVGGEAVYVRYRSDGAHNLELLGAFGFPSDVRRAIGAFLRSSPRLNASRTHMQLVAAVNVEELSARSGVELSKRQLLEAFDEEGLRFADDGPCELAGEEARRALRERALRAAREAGFTPYLDFFAHEEARPAAPARDLDPDQLDDEDLRRLLSHLHLGARS